MLQPIYLYDRFNVLSEDWLKYFIFYAQDRRLRSQQIRLRRFRLDSIGCLYILWYKFYVKMCVCVYVCVTGWPRKACEESTSLIKWAPEWERMEKYCMSWSSVFQTLSKAFELFLKLKKPILKTVKNCVHNVDQQHSKVGVFEIWMPIVWWHDRTLSNNLSNLGWTLHWINVDMWRPFKQDNIVSPEIVHIITEFWILNLI